MLLATFLEHGHRGGDVGPRFFFPLLLLILLGFFVGKMIRKRRGGGAHAMAGRGAPLSTLQDRFARGEIDRDEYEHRKAVLNGDETVPPAPARPTPPPPPATATPDAVVYEPPVAEEEE